MLRPDAPALADLGIAVDIEEPGFFTRPDYFDLLARLRDTGPVCAAGPNLCVCARHTEVREISRDTDRFANAQGVLINDPLRHGGSLVGGSILHMDPPDHGPWRQVTSRRFTPRAVATMEPRVRELTRRVFDALPAGEEIDFVERVAGPLPVLVIAELLGIDDADVAQFTRWSDATIDSPDNPGHGMDDLVALFRFLIDLVHARRAEPRDDLTSLLAHASVDGDPVTTEAAVGYCLSLLVAGNETTRHLLSGAAVALHEHGDQRAALARDPSAIPDAVEECLRWVTPIQAFGRTAREATTVDGVPIEAGDFVVMLYASANRDERAFGPDAGSFDVGRTFTTPHMAFGFGEHLCLGAALARLEARAVLEELLARHPGYVVTGPGEWTRSTLVRGLRTLPVVLGP